MSSNHDKGQTLYNKIRERIQNIEDDDIRPVLINQFYDWITHLAFQ